VSVREGAEWRVVGQYPDGTPAEALAYFERKYVDLAGEVTLLETRHRSGGASASDLRSTSATVRERVVGAAAVGDLAALEARLDALESTPRRRRPKRRRRSAKPSTPPSPSARGSSSASKRSPPATPSRSSGSRRRRGHRTLRAVAGSPGHRARLPKNTGQQLWKRFRDARATLDKHRREFYAGLDEQHKSARDAKARLVERAEALVRAARTASAPTARCSTSGRPRAAPARRPTTRCGRASRLPATRCTPPARAASRPMPRRPRRRSRPSAPARGGRRGAEEKDNAKARTLLTGIQRRWDEIGRIFPREAERALDDDLRKIEQGLKAREDADWKSNNPETKARQNDMTQQLRDAIAGLEADLEKAKASKDKPAIAGHRGLEARKSWLKALGG
jgi:hypothetical protein